MEIDRTSAETVASETLEAFGIRPSDAARTAEVLVSADAAGKHSHGIIRLPRFVRGIEHGNVDPDGEITITHDAGAAAVLDGGARLGPVVATRAIDAAVKRANEHGVGVVGVIDSNHLGMLGYYTNRAREAGSAAIAMTNTEPAMPPYGGAEAILGTNPIAIGLPTDPPFNLDMSTSSISRGEVQRRKEQGEPLPEGVALDASGQPTTDPSEALEGVILPFGGPKGAGLAIAVEVLAGGFVGAAMGSDVTGTFHTEDPCTKGDLFIAIDALSNSFESTTAAFFNSLKATPRAEGTDEIRLPGERSVPAARKESIEVDRSVWQRIQDLEPQ